MILNHKALSSDKLSIRQRIIETMLFALILIIGLAVGFDFYYDLNDDTTIKDILSGVYTGTPSGYSIQMLYPLGWIIALLYRAIPGVSWYGLFLCGCQFGALILIVWKVTGLTRNKTRQLIFVAATGLISEGLLVRQLVMVQYSVTSGMCMAAAVFLFMTNENVDVNPGEYIKKNILPIVLVVVSFMIRTELCLMLMPFLALAGLDKWLDDKRRGDELFVKERITKYLLVLGIALAGMALMFGIDKLAKRSEQWQQFEAYFDARTKIYDFYGIPDYESNKAFYESIGMSQESYALLQNYNFSLDEDINADVLAQMVEYQEKQAEKGQNMLSVLSGPVKLVTRQSLSNAIWVYRHKLTEIKVNHSIFAYTIIMAYLLYVIAACLPDYRCWWKILSLLAVRSAIWIYLYMVDRTVDRITYPLMLVELILLMCWIVNDTIISHEKKKYFTVAILTMCGIVALICNIKEVRNEYRSREQVNPRWESLIEYCKDHQDKYYLVDVYSSTSYDGIAYSEKMFKDVDNSYRNFDLCGGWVSKSPLMYEKLKQSNIDNVADSLIDGTTYFIASTDKQLNWMKEYYASKGINIELDCIDYVNYNSENIYSVYRINKID